MTIYSGIVSLKKKKPKQKEHLSLVKLTMIDNAMTGFGFFIP